MPALLWCRRDLRLCDHPAPASASDAAETKKCSPASCSIRAWRRRRAAVFPQVAAKSGAGAIRR
jgi:hypothetical protein